MDVSSTGGIDISQVSLRSSSESSRLVYINEDEGARRYGGNKVKTAKYGLVTFLPLFLLEQFRKWANAFFLVIALLQQIPGVSPTGQFTTIIPLLFILSVAATKEIFEDVKRQNEDKDINNRNVEVLRNGEWTLTKWMYLKVGDLVRITGNQQFAADIVLLSTSNGGGVCYIETSNLDGESNLKIRQALPGTSGIANPAELSRICGRIEAEPPNSVIHEFNAMLYMTDKDPEPLGPQQLVLRGTTLRNTDWIFGVVVYTGHETKLFMNYTRVPFKQSQVDILMNRIMMVLLIVFILFCVFCTIIGYYYSYALQRHYYLQPEKYSAKAAIYDFLTFVILLHSVIPISLEVTLEIVRLMQTVFIDMDIEMYHEETDTPANARTSNLNEELGQVKYIFADKTGTLTKNSLELREVAVNSQRYTIKQLLENKANNKELQELFLCMILCHSAICERAKNGTMKFNAESTDERALLDAAKKLGYVFEGRTADGIKINVRGNKRICKLLNVLEFNSTRRRMSVIVNDRGKIVLYCKGADTAMYDKLALFSSQNKNVSQLFRVIDTLAEEGLRTLCLAYRDLTKEQYDQFYESYIAANAMLRSRSAKLAELYDEMESNLIILGVTGIEDELQDGVPETIQALRAAKIKLWVLTGDKQQTAVNIGYYCKLLHRKMKIITMNEFSFRDTKRALRAHLESIADDERRHVSRALVIDGKTLSLTMTSRLVDKFMMLCMNAEVVVCCRVSPIQKADVVEQVRKRTSAVTLAIGDGANDVAMIRQAHVGVGISGAEGKQATSASDYSIAQFRYLRRLLFVHGAWNYIRVSKVILYSFYKNILLNTLQAWFATSSAFSGQNMFEEWSIGLYNVIFTVLPPFMIGIFDKPCSAARMLQCPGAYAYTQEGRLFNVKEFMFWGLYAITHSTYIYFATLCLIKHDVMWSSGNQINYFIFGLYAYTYVVIVVCLKGGLLTNAWTWVAHVCIWCSIASWFLYVTVCSYIWKIIPIDSGMNRIAQWMFSSPTYWLGAVFVPVLTLMPDVMITVLRHTLSKTELDVVRQLDVHHNPGGNRRISNSLWMYLRVCFRLRQNRRKALEVIPVPPAL